MTDSAFENNTPETATDLGTFAFEGNSFDGPTTTRIFDFDSVGQGTSYVGSNGVNPAFPFPFTTDVVDHFTFDPFELETVSVNFNAETVGTFTNFLAFLPISGVSAVSGAVVANWYGGLYLDTFPQPEPRNLTNAQAFALLGDLKRGDVLPGIDWSEATWVNSDHFAGAEAVWTLTGAPVVVQVFGFHYQGVPSQIEAAGFVPQEIDYRFTLLPLTGSIDDPITPPGDPDPLPDPVPDPAPGPIGQTFVNIVTVSQTLTGGAGIDFFDGRGYWDAFTYDVLSDGRIILTEVLRPERIDTLINIERIDLIDGFLAFDFDGNAGQAYRLYEAAFNRNPDAEGLGFWIDNYDAGNVDLVQMAEFFMQSEEFTRLYGAEETLSDQAFLTLLYANVLDRTPDQAGFDFWSLAQSNGVTRPEILQYFSESTENYANVAGEISDGIWYV